MTQLMHAFDRQSARSVDADGRMRVKNCILSTAEVNPYRGQEIPGWEKLGLNASTVYDLYRDPEALAAAVKSFEGVPLMVKHIAQTADEPRKEYIGGSVHGVTFDGKHLRGDLLVWDAYAIGLIESDEQSDLSCSYRYDPVMTSGEQGGAKFDGRMAKIQGNHVALVDEGRASDAHVADAALQSQHPDPSLQGDTMAFPNQAPPAAPGAAPAAPAAAPAAAAPAAPAAPDAGTAEVGAALKHIGTLLETVLQRLPAGPEAAAPAAPASAAETAAAPGAEDAGPDSPDGPGPDLSLETMPKIEGEGGGGAPAVPEGGDNPDLPAPDQEGTGARGGPTPHAAMDAKTVQSLITGAVQAERQRAKEVEEAKRAVRNVIGEVAMDNASDIYREALMQSGVDVTHIAKGTERVAWGAFTVGAAAAAGARPVRTVSHAADGKGDGSADATPSYMKHLDSISVKG